MSDKSSKCMLCRRAGDKECNDCKMGFCCDSHLVRHRHREAESCYPFRVDYDPDVGRFMVASRDIKEGELIFEDVPLAVGPNHETRPICLGCMAEIDVASYYACQECMYPFCEEDCYKTSFLNHKDECAYLRHKPYPSPPPSSIDCDNYHVLLPLRLLLLVKQDPDSFALSEQLMDHEEKRRKDSNYWDEINRKVVLKLRPHFTESQILRAIGVLDVNSYELHCSPSGCGFRGIFGIGVLLSHSCVPNVTILFSRQYPFKAKFVASTDIKAGNEICSKYLPPIVCSLRRRPMLRDSWYFDCKCKRCADPTELGTYVGAVVCQKCKGKNAHKSSKKRGAEVEEEISPSDCYLLPTDPLSEKEPWGCKSCSHLKPAAEIKKLAEFYLDQISEVVRTARYDLGAFLRLRHEAAQFFHPRHEVLCEIAKWALPIMCRGAQEEEFADEDFRLKTRIAENYIFVLDRVYPGISKMAAKVSFEHADAAFHLSQRELDQGLISAKEFKKAKNLLLKRLERAEKGLKLEGNLTPFEEWVAMRIEQLKTLSD